MAYKLADRVCPNLPGEFVGNYKPAAPLGPFNSQKEAEASLPDWSLMRQGAPRPTARFSSAELFADGWVGVYLKTELAPPAGAEVIPTPDWMNEPSA